MIDRLCVMKFAFFFLVRRMGEVSGGLSPAVSVFRLPFRSFFLGYGILGLKLSVTCTPPSLFDNTLEWMVF